MCWRSEKNPTALVAEEDIKVLKITYKFTWEDKDANVKVLYPFFRYDPHFLYTMNEETPLVPIKVQVRTTKCFIINEGYHSYKSSTEYRIVGNRIIIGMDTYKRTFIDEKIYLVEGVIPKGTTYYVNEYNECVSERIKLCKILASVGG